MNRVYMCACICVSVHAYIYIYIYLYIYICAYAHLHVQVRLYMFIHKHILPILDKILQGLKRNHKHSINLLHGDIHRYNPKKMNKVMWFAVSHIETI